jgi:hypothetical protein
LPRIISSVLTSTFFDTRLWHLKKEEKRTWESGDQWVLDNRPGGMGVPVGQGGGPEYLGWHKKKPIDYKKVNLHLNLLPLRG